MRHVIFPSIEQNGFIMHVQPTFYVAASDRFSSSNAVACPLSSSIQTRSSMKLPKVIHLRAASMKPKSLQNSVSERGTVVESFFCQLSSQLGSHFWSLGLSIGARKTISKGSLGL